MIQITLTFATLAAARAALLEIPESVLVQATSTGPQIDLPLVQAAHQAAATDAKPEAKKAKKSEPAAPAPEQLGSEKKPADPVESPAPQPAVEYVVLQKAVFALAGKSRDAAAAVAASFGVKTFRDLSPDRWAEALTAVQAKMAEV